MAAATKLTGRLLIHADAAELTLSPSPEEGGILLQWRTEGGDQCLELESEILGYEVQGELLTVKAFVDKRRRREFAFQMPTQEAADAWGSRLRDSIHSLGRPRRLFILLNPFGGKKCARKIFHNQVKPLLEDANIFYTLQETKCQLHAQEIVHSLDLLKYDGIVCVSGDGILVEVVNGLLQRKDWNTAIKVPLGIIPAGTGNGMAKSIADAVGDDYSISSAVVAVIRGHKRSLDVVTVSQEATKFFSVLMLAWGIVADVDIESEKYRWMGSARINFYSLLRVISLRRYHGNVQFVAAPGYEFHGEPVKLGVSRKDDVGVANGHEASGTCFNTGYQGPAADSKVVEWRSLDGPFILVWVNNVPSCSEDVIQAPEAKFSDGYLDVVIIRDCSKSALASILLNMSDGSHVKSPYVIYLKVKAFRLEPGQRVGDPTKGGIIDSDGEVIARGGGGATDQQKELMVYGRRMEMAVDQGLATIFSPR